MEDFNLSRLVSLYWRQISAAVVLLIVVAVCITTVFATPGTSAAPLPGTEASEQGQTLAGEPNTGLVSPESQALLSPGALTPTAESAAPTNTPELPKPAPPTVTPEPPAPIATPQQRESVGRGERQAIESAQAEDAAAAPEAVVEAAPEPVAEAAPSKLAGKKVGLQAGHWLCAELPAEFASLRRSTGAAAAGYTEANVNLKVARLAAEMLQAQGIIVDVLPSTVPVKYKADVFVSIHADGNNSSGPRGFKIARPSRSAIPKTDDALVSNLNAEYAKATGLPRTDGTITSNMRYYYAFNSGNQHTVASTTPSAILEMGYLTNPTDRNMMVNKSAVVAEGLANGIIAFLNAQ